MSLNNGVWFNAGLEQPKAGEEVLAVMELRSGRRKICLASWWKNEYGSGWVTVGGCNNVIYWMQLPKIPEK